MIYKIYTLEWWDVDSGPRRSYYESQEERSQAMDEIRKLPQFGSQGFTRSILVCKTVQEIINALRSAADYGVE